jgi:hypothetical protein
VASAGSAGAGGTAGGSNCAGEAGGAGASGIGGTGGTEPSRYSGTTSRRGTGSAGGGAGGCVDNTPTATAGGGGGGSSHVANGAVLASAPTLSSAATSLKISWDLTPPETFIASGPERLQSIKSATIELSSSDNVGVTGYVCTLNFQPYSPCGAVNNLTDLPHNFQRFEASAVDANGNVDPTPAVWTWAVRYVSAISVESSVDRQGPPPVVGQPVDIHITVTGDGDIAPQGLVAVFNGTRQLSATVPLNAEGKGLLTYSFSPGTNVISARYRGSLDHLPSETEIQGEDSSANFASVKATSEVALGLSQTEADPNGFAGLTLTAQVGVVAPGGGVPAGKVTFFNNGIRVGTAVTLANGQASINYLPPASRAQHTFTVVYAGSALYTPDTSEPAVFTYVSP